DRQRNHVLDVAAHQPLEAVADPDDLDAFERSADRRRADDAVDAGSGTAADEDAQLVVLLHPYPSATETRPTAGSVLASAERKNSAKSTSTAAAPTAGTIQMRPQS